MKVLMLSTDKKIFEEKSEVHKRMSDFGSIFDELHIIVHTKKLTIDNQRLTAIGNNIFVYPTNTKFKPFYFWNAYKIAKSLIVGHDLTIITAQDPFETGLAGWFLKKKYKLPLQLQIHADIFSFYFWKESWKNKLRVLLAKFLLPKADGIRVVSQRIRDSLTHNLRLTTDNVTVLPVFVDIKKIQSAKIKINLHQKYPEHDFIILMASRLTPEKNIGLAIEAIAEVVKKYPRTLLLIVGEGPEKEKLKVKSEKLKVNAVFEPWTGDLASYYKTADLFLLTSNYEGYGRTVVEAMAAGLPVIMTDAGLAGELLIDDLDGKVISVGNKKALAAAILKLKENPAKREDFKLNSLKLLEKWPSRHEYLEEYQNLLKLLS